MIRKVENCVQLMFAEHGVVLSPSTVYHVPRPKTDSQTLSLGPHLQPVSLDVLPHYRTRQVNPPLNIRLLLV